MVALVVTIVIILILATISANVAFGPNGLVAKSRGFKNNQLSEVASRKTELETVEKQYVNMMASEYDYSTKMYTLIINYKYEDGEKVAEPYIGKYQAGAKYSIESPESQDAGYEPELDLVSGIMPEKDIEINVIYTKKKYLVTIQYIDTAGNKLYPDYVEEHVPGELVNASKSPPAGYVYESGDATFTMPANDVNISIVYRVMGAVIPPDPVPM